MKRKGLIRLLVGVFFLFISITLTQNTVWGGEVPGVTDNTVLIGGMGDLTGPTAEIWVPCAEALRTHFRYINDTGGVHGRKIKFILENDHFSIPRALSAFKKLIFRDKVFAAQGASGMGHTHAIIPLAEKLKIPMIAVTNDNRYFQPVRKYIFSPLPFYEDQIKLIFEYLFEDLKKKDPIIAFATADVGSGKICRDLVREQAKVFDVKDVYELILPLGAADCTTQVISLKKRKTEYVIIYGFPANTSAFLRDAMRLGLSSTFIVLQYGCVESTVRIAGKSAKNMIGLNCCSSWDEDSPGMKKMREITYKYHPDSGRRDRNFINGWVIGFLLYEGLKNTGRDLSREAFVKGLEAINDFDTGGICGIISYGPNDHKPIDYSRFYKADPERGRLIPISDWRKPKGS